MMIITFCGHAQIYGEKNLEERIFKEIMRIAQGKPVVFYLGGYGDFDSIAKNACLQYKHISNDSILIFVTPYIESGYLKNRDALRNGYDKIVYPDIEKTPKRYAIVERNKFMVRQSDYLISYVRFSRGGAFQMLEYAKKHKKSYINLAEDKKVRD